MGNIARCNVGRKTFNVEPVQVADGCSVQAQGFSGPGVLGPSGRGGGSEESEALRGVSVCAYISKYLK